MGIITKVHGTIVHDVYEFPNGATLTSTSTTTTAVVASSAFTVTDTLTVSADIAVSSAAVFSGAVSVSSAGTFIPPNMSTATAPTAVGYFGYSTASGKLIFAASTSSWVIVSTA